MGRGKDDSTSGDHKSAVQERYMTFVSKNRRFWITFNILATLASLALAISTFIIVWNAEYDCAMPSLKVPLWLIGFMHLINCLETLINLTGLEKHLCSCLFGCLFFGYELTVLIYMQVIYFDARDCMRQTPLLYFWLLFQILVFYMVIVFSVCFIFRKFCGDPNEVHSDSDDE